VSAGIVHTLALREDGTVVAWGQNVLGQSNVPAGLSEIAAIAAGGFHNVALKSNGTVVCWGYDIYGQTTPPADLSGVIAVAAGYYHSMALKGDGTVVVWGDHLSGQKNVPGWLDGVVKISAGGNQCQALRVDGSAVFWGATYSAVGLSNGIVPITALAAGSAHALALRNNGTVAAWGSNLAQQTVVPSGLRGVTAVAGGGRRSVALFGSTLMEPVVVNQPASLTAIAGRPKTLHVGAAHATAYRWLFNGTELSGATNATLTVSNLTRAAAGTYSVMVSNGIAGVQSSNATVRVLVPQKFAEEPKRLPDGSTRLMFGDADGFSLTDSNLPNFVVEATTNLLSTNWLAYTNGFTITNGMVRFDDPESTGQVRRFYRVIER